MKIQKLEAKIEAGICTDSDIESYLRSEELKPIIAAEQRYAELLATPDREPKPEVTDTRTVIVSEAVYDGPDENGEYTLVTPAVTGTETYIVSEAIDYNSIRDAEIAQLEVDYPHLVEPVQTYSPVETTNEVGGTVTVEVADVMPTVEQRRPELVLDYVGNSSILVRVAKSAIQRHIDSVANRYALDTIHNAGKFAGYSNSRQVIAEALGGWTSECWDAGNAMLASGEWPGVDGIIASLPEFVEP